MKKEKKYYYLKRGTNRPLVFTAKIKNVGQTKEDYFQGKLIQLSDFQTDFFSDNPYASFDEIINMMIKPAVDISPPEIPIEERYKQRVREEISKEYTFEDEIRILYNGKNTPEWKEHEDFVSEVKKRIKKELEWVDEE